MKLLSDGNERGVEKLESCISCWERPEQGRCVHARSWNRGICLTAAALNMYFDGVYYLPEARLGGMGPKEMPSEYKYVLHPHCCNMRYTLANRRD